MDGLRHRCRMEAKNLIQQVDWEFRRRYRLAPTDPRYLEATLEEMWTDVWAWRFEENPKLLDEDIDPNFNPDAVADEIPDLPVPVPDGGTMLVSGIDDFEDLERGEQG